MRRSSHWIGARIPAMWSRWTRPAVPLCRGRGAALPGRGEHRDACDVARVRGRRAVERERREGVVVAEIASAALRHEVGLKPGDVLIAIDDRPVQRPPMSLASCPRPARSDASLHRCFGWARARSSTCASRRCRRVPGRSTSCSRPSASSRCSSAVRCRLRRPRDPATLHFFWVAVAFFGVITFSFSGRLDRLDWVFYWSDAVSILALPPLFLHFTLVFPERPRRWMEDRSDARSLLPSICPRWLSA